MSKLKKRSHSVKLVAMGAGILALTACEEKVDVSVFKSVEQCAKFMDAADCEEKFRQAKEMHATVAPKYNSPEDCVADFGEYQCEEAPYRTRSGSSVFMPLMVGYMMGRSMSGAPSSMSQPLYRSADDPKNFRTADNRRVGSTTGHTKVGRSATRRPSIKSYTVARGGFGSRASASG